MPIKINSKLSASVALMVSISSVTEKCSFNPGLIPRLARQPEILFLSQFHIHRCGVEVKMVSVMYQGLLFSESDTLVAIDIL